jgi:autophagy-related protein 17
MAQHLESLTAHYDQMANALKEVQAGESYEEEDITSKYRTAYAHIHVCSYQLDMNRDVEELPAIIGELESAIVLIQAS